MSEPKYRQPRFMNVRPVMMHVISWPWKIYSSPSVLHLQDLPDLTTYYDWHSFILEGCDRNHVHSFGTRDHKSLFDTAVRIVGKKDLLEKTPPLGKITSTFIDWNLKLLKTSPVPLDYFMIGDVIADGKGPFMSPALFRTWLLPEYKKLMEFLPSSVSKIMILSGDVYKLLPDLVSLNIGLLLFEPVGEMRELYKASEYDNLMISPWRKMK